MGRTKKRLLLLLSILSAISKEPPLPQVLADPDEDRQALLDFLLNTPHSRPLNWRPDTPVCDSWTGVTCLEDRSSVVSLRLPGMGFHGPILPNTLTRLSAIRVLSLRFNSFSGTLPFDFSVWENVTVLDLSNNRFSGTIPGSVSRLSRITALNLANNSLSGEIPDVSLSSSLKWINLANNKLTGPMPRSFRKFPSWAFSGNHLSSWAESETRSPRLRVKTVSDPVVLGMALGVSTFGFVVISISMIACCSSNKVDLEILVDSNSTKKSMPEREDRIVSFKEFGYSFRFPDLLELSAEVLGRGTFGSTYKVDLKDEVVIKWVAELSAKMAEFEQLMGVVGEIRHETVAPLRAYYCSENEKLLIYDYYSKGSVSSILHGKGEDRQIPLSWERRLKIVIGVARGLAYIHTQNGRRLVHGNLKASNVFFNSLGFGCLSEIGITTLKNSIPRASSSQSEEYRAPEVVDSQSTSQESDVYSFGVLMLELLTGKSSTLHTKQFCLIRWVNSVIQNEWSAEVFDVELLRCPNIEDEMVEMLRIGIACVTRMPGWRPKMPEVVDMVEAIYRARTKYQPYSDQKSP